MIVIYPFGENVKNELNKLDSQFLVENNTTFSLLSSFNEKIANNADNLTAMFMDVDEIDVLNFDFSQFDVLLCKTKGEKDLSVLRKNQVVFEISNDHDLALWIEVLKFHLIDGENAINIDFADVINMLLETQKSIVLGKTIHYSSLEDLSNKIDYFPQVLKEKNITDCNLIVYLGSSYDLRLDAIDLVIKTITKNIDEDNVVIFGTSFNENFPNKTLRVILVAGIL